MNKFLSDGKITLFLAEIRKKTGENHHFNIFFRYYSLMFGVFSLSLLTQYIKINYKGGNYMANKRTLKHAIHLICEELFAEAIALSLYGAKPQQENAQALLYTIVKLEDEFTKRISHPEPGIDAKVYFKDLREKFSVQVSEIVDQLNG